MKTVEISGGTVHEMPADLREAIQAEPGALAAWESLTPLARNEWICWTTLVKQEATRQNHVERTVTELMEGKRRPCCWLGCLHRSDKKISPSVQAMLDKRKPLIPGT